MDNQGTYKVQKSAIVLMSDQHYFNYVFKKTEKIVSTVFYILHNHKDIKDSPLSLVSDIARASKDTLESLTETLTYERHEATGALIKAVAALVRLDSYVQLGRAAGVFSQDAGEVLEGEIEGVTRSISRYTEEGFTLGGSGSAKSPSGQRDAEPRAASSRRGTQVGIQSGARSSSPGTGFEGGVSAGAAHSARQDQIRDIIMEKKTVSIKDISEDIKDCSEKTIQRELNTMIDKGLVKREGERRWSRYSLI